MAYYMFACYSILQRIISCHIISYQTIPYHIISYHIISYMQCFLTVTIKWGTSHYGLSKNSELNLHWRFTSSVFSTLRITLDTAAWRSSICQRSSAHCSLISTVSWWIRQILVANGGKIIQGLTDKEVNIEIWTHPIEIWDFFNESKKSTKCV